MPIGELKRPEGPVGLMFAPAVDILRYAVQLENYADDLEQTIIRLRNVVSDARIYMHQRDGDDDLMDKMDEVLKDTEVKDSK